MTTIESHDVSIESVTSEFETHLELGLSSQESQTRLEQYGPNELMERPRPGFFSLLLDQFNNFLVIINTTPLGTYPDTDSFPDIPYDLLTENYLLYDLVYNPPETKFMKLGMQKGAKAVNGYEMLKLQADKSWEIWTNP